MPRTASKGTGKNTIEHSGLVAIRDDLKSKSKLGQEDLNRLLKLSSNEIKFISSSLGHDKFKAIFMLLEKTPDSPHLRSKRQRKQSMNVMYDNDLKPSNPALGRKISVGALEETEFDPNFILKSKKQKQENQEEIAEVVEVDEEQEGETGLSGLQQLLINGDILMSTKNILAEESGIKTEDIEEEDQTASIVANVLNQNAKEEIKEDSPSVDPVKPMWIDGTKSVHDSILGNFNIDKCLEGFYKPTKGNGSHDRNENSSRYPFFDLIQKMMFAFGDCREINHESGVYMHEFTHQWLIMLLGNKDSKKNVDYFKKLYPRQSKNFLKSKKVYSSVRKGMSSNVSNPHVFDDDDDINSPELSENEMGE